MKKLRIGIVGAGRMGRIRAFSASTHPLCEVVQVIDTQVEQANSLAYQLGCSAGTEWNKLLQREDVDAIVVATPHKFLAPITAAALMLGKHVFCEKPGARNAKEMEEVLRIVNGDQMPDMSGGSEFTTPRHALRATIGFTLRHHTAISQARRLLKEGVIGRPMYICARYGHGGRPGYEGEWRGNSELAGGGELLDQGIHLIDLVRWFIGEFEEVQAHVATCFWGASNTSADVRLEDNAFLLLRARTGKVAWLHASWTQWENMFSFEVYGEDGFLQASGLGGNYGSERLTIGRRRREGGPPKLKQIDFADENSRQIEHDPWKREWEAFVSGLIEVRQESLSSEGSPSASAQDAWEALRIVEAAYSASRNGVSVSLSRSAARNAAVSQT